MVDRILRLASSLVREVYDGKINQYFAEALCGAL